MLVYVGGKKKVINICLSLSVTLRNPIEWAPSQKISRNHIDISLGLANTINLNSSMKEGAMAFFEIELLQN